MSDYRRTTREVARGLGCGPDLLHAIIRRGKMPEPERDAYGYFVWGATDVKAAMAALACDWRTKAGRAGRATRAAEVTHEG